MTWIIVVLLLGVNQPFHYVDRHQNYPECYAAMKAWKLVKEAQIVIPCKKYWKVPAVQHKA